MVGFTKRRSNCHASADEGNAASISCSSHVNIFEWRDASSGYRQHSDHACLAAIVSSASTQYPFIKRSQRCSLTSRYRSNGIPNNDPASPIVQATAHEVNLSPVANARPMQPQNLKMVYPFNIQSGASANANLKLPAGRQCTAVTSPLQQPTPLANTTDGLTGAVPMSSSPSTTHTTPDTQPARTPSANGSRPATRTSSVGNGPVGPMMNAGQYTTHSLSPHLQ
ncbi:hypothetical protein BJ138DRAFT_1236932 [Hygrophoropsis aurantiaca]|uniref:Uncharacterized protein n=1 Tax=Hygrophoropsis aurantiaca TaxID=72124 RepID=A0ACB7ZTT6_9AGAM|nr:hypothetical protein BJ138DRAFT_1236932 [Hygrophoropsis aurantiaca]